MCLPIPCLDPCLYHSCCCRHRRHSIRDMADQAIQPHGGDHSPEDPARLRAAPGGHRFVPREPAEAAVAGLVEHHLSETVTVRNGALEDKPMKHTMFEHVWAADPEHDLQLKQLLASALLAVEEGEATAAALQADNDRLKGEAHITAIELQLLRMRARADVPSLDEVKFGRAIRAAQARAHYRRGFTVPTD